MKDISVVITSCGRVDKLKKTIDSFLQFNTYPNVKFFLIDDSGDASAQAQIVDIMPNGTTFIMHNKNKGQVISVDEVYARVDTEFLFHLEEDWLFYRGDFIEKSLAVLESDSKILQVWLRDVNDTNQHPVEKKVYVIGGVACRYMSLGALGNNWFGFTWNPGLRRLRDYKLVAPFMSYYMDGDFAALTECRIGRRYYNLGFRAVILLDGYIKHII